MIMHSVRFTERSYYQIKDKNYPVEEVGQNEYKYLWNIGIIINCKIGTSGFMIDKVKLIKNRQCKYLLKVIPYIIFECVWRMIETRNVS